MTTFIVREIDEPVMRSLNSLAAWNGVTAEEETLQILKLVLPGPGWKTFDEVLMAMPHVDDDSVFERSATRGTSDALFD